MVEVLNEKVLMIKIMKYLFKDVAFFLTYHFSLYVMFIIIICIMYKLKLTVVNSNYIYFFFLRPIKSIYVTYKVVLQGVVRYYV